MQTQMSPESRRVAYVAAAGNLELYNKLPRVPGRVSTIKFTYAVISY